MNKKELDEQKFSVLDIAMVKSYAFMRDYDPVSGKEVEKDGSLYLKEGYVAGFLDGFTHKFGGDDAST